MFHSRCFYSVHKQNKPHWSRHLSHWKGYKACSLTTDIFDRRFCSPITSGLILLVKERPTCLCNENRKPALNAGLISSNLHLLPGSALLMGSVEAGEHGGLSSLMCSFLIVRSLVRRLQTHAAFLQTHSNAQTHTYTQRCAIPAEYTLEGNYHISDWHSVSKESSADPLIRSQQQIEVSLLNPTPTLSISIS